MSEWRSYTLEELAAPTKSALATGPFGSAISSRYFMESGVPVIRGSNLSVQVGKRLIEDGLAFIEEEKAKEFARSQAVRGDLVFTCWGTIGQLGFIDNKSKYERYIVSNKQMKLTPNAAIVHPLFLYYALSAPDSISAIQNMAIGSSVPGFNLTQLKRIRVFIPSLKKQEGIVEILQALDDKIAVNDRMAMTVRELEYAYFARTIKDSGMREVDLASVVDVLVRGISPKYSEDHEQLTVLNQKCVRNGRVNLALARKTLKEKVSSVKLLQQGDVLVNSTGVGTLGRVARWTLDQPATVDSHVTIVRFNPLKVDPVCGGFAMLRAQPKIEELGEGSTGQTELSRAQLGGLRLLLPSEERMAELRPKLDALEQRGDAALAESLVLAKLRDMLLPKLMSGEIRVRDAEKAVEDAL